MTVSGLVARYRAHIVRLLRYASVSVISTATSLTVLGILVGLVNAPAGWSNAIATTIATVPSFELNRRWVWSYKGQRMVFRQVVPFFVLSLTGLGLSTLNVSLAGQWATHHHVDRLLRTGLLGFTNVATFGLLWVFQYVLCDRVLFRNRSTSDEELEDGDDLAGGTGATEVWDVGDVLEAAPSRTTNLPPVE
ncbi:MAG: GtrA family protein [Actinomycetota bacterium]